MEIKTGEHESFLLEEGGLIIGKSYLWDDLWEQLEP